MNRSIKKISRILALGLGVLVFGGPTGGSCFDEAGVFLSKVGTEFTEFLRHDNPIVRPEPLSLTRPDSPEPPPREGCDITFVKLRANGEHVLYVKPTSENKGQDCSSWEKACSMRQAMHQFGVIRSPSLARPIPSTEKVYIAAAKGEYSFDNEDASMRSAQGGGIGVDGSILPIDGIRDGIKKLYIGGGYTVGDDCLNDGKPVNTTILNGKGKSSSSGNVVLLRSEFAIEDITIKNFTIKGGRAQGLGVADPDKKLSVQSGAGLNAQGKIQGLVLENLTFEDNRADNKGGCFDINGNVEGLKLTDIVAKGCHAKNGGGAGHIGGGKITFKVAKNLKVSLSDTDLTNVDAHGGGILLDGVVTGDFFGVDIEGCKAGGRGGALAMVARSNLAKAGDPPIILDMGTLGFANPKFDKNIAKGEGGAVAIFNEAGVAAAPLVKNPTEDYKIRFLNAQANGNEASRGGGYALLGGVGLGVAMKGGSMSGNTANQNEGGGLYAEGGVANVALKDVVVKGNKIVNPNSSNGVGIYVADMAAAGSTNFAILGGEISGHVGSHGAGIYFHGVTGVLLGGGTLVEKNTATSSCGGGFFDDTELSITDWKVKGNTSQASFGGGLCFMNSLVKFHEKMTYQDNKALGSGPFDGGGALYVSNPQGKFPLKEIVCEGNTATNLGGCAAILRAQAVDIEGGSYKRNTVSGGSGGALYYTGDPGAAVASLKVTLTKKVEFAENKASGDGGALHLGNVGQFVLVGNDALLSMNKNTSTGGNGGAIYANFKLDVGTEMTLSGGAASMTALTNNKADTSDKSGGAIYVANAPEKLDISRAAFTNNTCNRDGAGLHINAGVIETFTTSNQMWKRNDKIYVSADLPTLFKENINKKGDGAGLNVRADITADVKLMGQYNENQAPLGKGGAVAFMGTIGKNFGTEGVGYYPEIEVDKKVVKPDGESRTEHVQFLDNIAGRNPAIHFEQTEVAVLGAGLDSTSFDRTDFERNNCINAIAGRNGGLLDIQKPLKRFSLTDGKVISNSKVSTGETAKVENGGAFALKQVTEKIGVDRVTASGHSAGANGGFLYVELPSAVALELLGSTIDQNEAKLGNGGAFYLPKIRGTDPADAGVQFVMSNVTSDSNTAGGSGGAYYFGSIDRDLSIASGSLRSNTAKNNGGAIHIEGDVAGSIRISGGSLNSNTALGGDGGGINVVGLVTGDLDISESAGISGNKALSGQGGAISLAQGARSLQISSRKPAGKTPLNGLISAFLSLVDGTTKILSKDELSEKGSEQFIAKEQELFPNEHLQKRYVKNMVNGIVTERKKTAGGDPIHKFNPADLLSPIDNPYLNYLRNLFDDTKATILADDKAREAIADMVSNDFERGYQKFFDNIEALASYKIDLFSTELNRKIIKNPNYRAGDLQIGQIYGNQAQSGGALFIASLTAPSTIDSQAIVSNVATSGDGGGFYIGNIDTRAYVDPLLVGLDLIDNLWSENRANAQGGGGFIAGAAGLGINLGERDFIVSSLEPLPVQEDILSLGKAVASGNWSAFEKYYDNRLAGTPFKNALEKKREMTLDKAGKDDLQAELDKHVPRFFTAEQNQAPGGGGVLYVKGPVQVSVKNMFFKNKPPSLNLADAVGVQGGPPVVDVSNNVFDPR